MSGSENMNMLVFDDFWSEGYGIVPRSVMRNPALSIDAKVMYAYLCAADGGKHPCTQDAIQRDLKLEDTRFALALEELSNYMRDAGHPMSIVRMVA